MGFHLLYFTKKLYCILVNLWDFLVHRSILTGFVFVSGVSIITGFLKNTKKQNMDSQ